MFKSGDILITTFVGGLGIFWGPIAGVCFLTYLNDTLSSFTKHWVLIQGAIFVAVVMYAPDGISGLLLRIKNRIFDRFKIEKG